MYLPSLCLGIILASSLPGTSHATLWGDTVSDMIAECTDDDVDFDVQLDFGNDKKFEAKCKTSYSRCGLPDKSCLGNADDWTNDSGETFEYLETRTFYVSDDSSPKSLYVNDVGKGTHRCARALFKGSYQDFSLGSGALNLESWWGGSDPLHITIVPFNANGSCEKPSDAEFDPERALAIFITPYAGNKTGGSSVYCDVSKNPEDCLNLPFWEIDTTNNQLVLWGTLTNVLKTDPSEVNIYIPEGYDVSLPINNNVIRFKISNGSEDNCKKFLNGGDESCAVDAGWVDSFYTEAKLTVSGLGRVEGWNAVKNQEEQNIKTEPGADGDIGMVGKDNSDFGGYWKSIGEWYIMAYLVSLASHSSGAGDGYAIDVSGIEVAWGSRLGTSAMGLNSRWQSGDITVESFPAKMYDVKQVGNWNDQSDGVDIMGAGSYSAYTYIHANDDAVKVAATDTIREQSTVLKGNAGCVVNLGSYGKGNIDRSSIDGVYVHRIVHSHDQYSGCPGGPGEGGVVCTRSYAENDNGLVDTTITDLHIPELGSINTVAQPFGIGVSEAGPWSTGAPADKKPYPIRNLVFKHFEIHPDPSCKSNIYDAQGFVQWGWGKQFPSMTFFDPYDPSTDPEQCHFLGAVEFTDNPAYFVCGLNDSEAPKYCMNNQKVEGLNNVEYSTVNNAKVNIDYPTCNYPGDMDVAVA